MVADVVCRFYSGGKKKRSWPHPNSTLAAKKTKIGPRAGGAHNKKWLIFRYLLMVPVEVTPVRADGELYCAVAAIARKCMAVSLIRPITGWS